MVRLSIDPVSCDCRGTGATQNAKEPTVLLKLTDYPTGKPCVVDSYAIESARPLRARQVERDDRIKEYPERTLVETTSDTFVVYESVEDIVAALQNGDEMTPVIDVASHHATAPKKRSKT